MPDKPAPIVSVDYLKEKLRERNERMKLQATIAEECVAPPIPPPPPKRDHHRGERRVELCNYDAFLVSCSIHPLEYRYLLG